MRKRKKYIFITIKGKTYREHRLIVEKAIGRKLRVDEAVHHIDGNGMNNDLLNLQIINIREHNTISGRQMLTGAILLPKYIPIIRKMISNGESFRYISSVYGVSYDAIKNINSGRTWGWLI